MIFGRNNGNAQSQVRHREKVMTDEQGFQNALQEHPDDNSLRLIYADWLGERGDPRAELIRLLHTLTQTTAVPDRNRLEDRLRNLVASGVQPVGPFMTNSVGMKFVWIPAGTFLMGSPTNEEGRRIDEPRHEVTISKGYYLADGSVGRGHFAKFVQASGYKTQAETEGGAWGWTGGDWKKKPDFNWRNPGFHQTDDHPVVCVSWNDAVAFCRWLSEQDKHNYRLPTEAEWEYACRAGTTTAYHFGNAISTDLSNHDLAIGATTPIGKYQPNALGLFDMHGNVLDWCADWSEDDYPSSNAVDPQGPESGEHRVLRGGSFDNYAMNVRSAAREANAPEARNGSIGFRPVRTLGLRRRE